MRSPASSQPPVGIAQRAVLGQDLLELQGEPGTAVRRGGRARRVLGRHLVARLERRAHPRQFEGGAAQRQLDATRRTRFQSTATSVRPILKCCSETCCTELSPSKRTWPLPCRPLARPSKSIVASLPPGASFMVICIRPSVPGGLLQSSGASVGLGALEIEAADHLAGAVGRHLIGQGRADRSADIGFGRRKARLGDEGGRHRALQLVASAKRHLGAEHLAPADLDQVAVELSAAGDVELGAGILHPRRGVR